MPISNPQSPFPKSPIRQIYDFVGFPLRTVAFKEETVERLGMTSLQQERINAIWPFIQGRLLDVGAGNNRLVKLYGNGIGVDVYPWDPSLTILKDTSRLPFKDEEFETVAFIACLNHIPEREKILIEARRVLKPGGRCLITMIDPIIGFINHKLCWYEESHERGMEEGELDGLWPNRMRDLLKNAGFRLEREIPFLYRLNRLFVANRP